MRRGERFLLCELTTSQNTSNPFANCLKINHSFHFDSLFYLSHVISIGIGNLLNLGAVSMTIKSSSILEFTQDLPVSEAAWRFLVADITVVLVTCCLHGLFLCKQAPLLQTRWLMIEVSTIVLYAIRCSGSKCGSNQIPTTPLYVKSVADCKINKL